MYRHHGVNRTGLRVQRSLRWVPMATVIPSFGMPFEGLRTSAGEVEWNV